MLDLDLQKTPEPPREEAPPKRPVGLWIVVAVLVAAMAVAAYITFGRQTASQPAAPARQAAAAAQPDQPLGGDAAAIVIPPLNESDSVVRELVRQLSTHPRVAAWLATNGLIRNFTVSVANIAEGTTPTRHLAVLRPSSGFQVTERGGDLFIDPLSYQRYDALADATASIDPAGAARLYATLKPRIEEAHRELGMGETSFDRTLERAIVSLLETPVLGDRAARVRTESRGIGYGYVDPKVEALTPAQKQLLRMGPRNVQRIQSSLRAIARALGIPSERLSR